jgi:DNA primase
MTVAMTGTPRRLSDAEIARVKRNHAIVHVLSRMGITTPPNWDGSSDYRIPAAALGFPHGRDDSQGVQIHPMTGYWHAYHGNFGGDVLALVARVTGVTPLRTIARILDSLAPIEIKHADTATALRYATEWSERPDLDRTPIRRVHDANAVAWRYLTLPRLAERARDYLRHRGIDVTALERETRQPLAGHTPTSRTGLVDHLRRRRFTDDEIVDSGWGVRAASKPMRDKYRHRVLLPFRDDGGRVVGVTGRDVTRRAIAKYLNHPKTLTFDKSAALYRPASGDLDEHATVIVCEGTLDALAIAAAAARVGASSSFAPVTQSGLSLTDHVAPRIFALHHRPPVLCGDGDEAGQKATVAWVDRAMRIYHREVLTLTLPDGMDPAEWLKRQGDLGLVSFTRTGCLDDEQRVRPKPAGGLLARYELARAIACERDPSIETPLIAPTVIDRLGKRAAQVPHESAIKRFADEAGKTLAQLVDGMGAEGRAQQVLEAANRHIEVAEPDSRQPIIRRDATR